MLDINLFRKEKGFNPEVVRESQRRRFGNVDLVDEVIELDKECRQRRFELDNLRKDSNRISKEVSRLKAAKQDASELIKKNSEENKKVTAVKEKEVKDAHATLDERLELIGNLVHDTVPVSDNEENNVIIRHSGAKRTDSGLKNHVELVNLLGIVDMVKGAAVAGSRGYYLLGAGYNLNQALISFAVDFLGERGYTPLRTPSLMRKDIMAKCAQLSQFHEELYKVTGDGDDKNPTATSEQPRCRDDKDLTTTSEGDDQNITTTSEGDDKNSRLTSQQPSCRDDKYLTATSEQPLCALHMDDCIDPPKLPIRYAGISTCFRKEAGSHGRDSLGIFRVHEFDKVEQFCITSPNGNDSWEMHEEMIKNSEEFYQKLKIPYQVVSIVSGALNDAAAKKYDLEGWFPASATYRELVSCSNCTDYQSRKLNIRYGHNKGQYVHLLNSTLTATQRTICCILENYQREDGVEVPEVLRPYMRNVAFLPFKSIPNGESKKSKLRLV